MKIAVASQNKSSITSHTAKCRNFWIYEVNPKEVLGKELLELSKEQTFHNSSPHDPHPLDNVRVLISGGIGKGLMRRLEKQGIEGVVTLASDPDLAVISYLENSRLRHYLARLHRKTFCYSKSVEMLEASIRLLFYYLRHWTIPISP